MPSRWWHMAAFAGLIALAAVLRLAFLPEAGIFAFDEARYLLDGVAKQTEMGVVAEAFQRKAAEMRGGPAFSLEAFANEAHARLAANGQFWPKFVFNYLTGAVLVIAGFIPWAGNLVEAIFGILTVALTYLFVRDLAGRRAGLIASGLLAVMAYHVFHSRTGFPQTTPGFFALVAVWLHVRWVRSQRRGPLGLMGGGLAAGLAFGASYQALAILPLLGVVHGAACWRLLEGRRLSSFFSGGVLMAAGFFGAVLALECVGHGFMLFFRAYGLDYPHPTFLETTLPRLGYHTGYGILWQGVLVFPFFLSVYEGWLYLGGLSLLAVLVLGGGTAGGGFRREAGNRAYVAALYLGFGLALPFLLFALKGMTGPRPYVLCLPFLAGLAGWMGAHLWQSGGRGLRTGAVAALACMAAAGLWGQAEILRMRNAFPDVVCFLATQGQTAAAPYGLVLDCYLRAGDLPRPGVEGADYWVGDMRDLYAGVYPDESLGWPKVGAPAQVFAHRFGWMQGMTEGWRANVYEDIAPLASIRMTRGLDLERARQVLLYANPLGPLR